MENNPSRRREGLTIQLWCEGCSATPKLILYQHKRCTYIRALKHSLTPPPRNKKLMTEQSVKELLFSLAWCPYSYYHSQNVKDILNKEFPDTDFSDIIEEFKEIYLSTFKSGSPK
jgi:hypothetical protein